MSDRSPVLVSKRALQLLGWPELVRELAGRAQTEGGVALALERPFLGEAAVSRSLVMAAEVLRLRAQRVSVGLGGAHDVRALAERARRSSTLSGADLWMVLQTVSVLGELTRTARQHAAEAPVLFSRPADIDDYRELRKRLARSVDEEGKLLDTASAALQRLRQRARSLSQELRRRAEELAGQLHRESILQDDFFTVRDDRFVLPVKSGQRGQVSGIVHGASNTGQTLFIEPGELVRGSNDLTLVRAEIAEEEERILGELSGLIGGQAHELIGDVSTLFEFDVAWAVGRLAEVLDAQPALVSDAEVELRSVRHPLMTLAMAAEGGAVVPNDIILDPEVGAFVITGPNTGGKTVVLKSAGLCALMHRAGIPLPAVEPSRLPLFDSVVCVLGDDQSLTTARSTFSSHVEVIAQGLESAQQVAAEGGTALVLLDELVADTDPQEGGALAQAIIEAFLEAGARLIVTTHHQTLKAAAMVEAGWRNAAVGFDAETLAPTYKLVVGVPGASNPFDIAGLYGMPDHVIRRARALAVEEGDALSRALAELEQARLAAEAERDVAVAERVAAQAARVEAERAQRALEEEQERLEHDRDRAIEEVRGEARALVAGAVEEARATVARMQKGGMREAVEAQKELSREVERLAQPITSPPVRAPEAVVPNKPVKPTKPAKPAKLEVGGRVEVAGLGAIGEVLEIDHKRKEAMVLLGSMRSRFRLNKLTPHAGRPARSGSAATSGKSGGVHVSAAGVDRRLELLGKRADDALAELEQFLDRAVRQGFDDVCIVHGHGTGVLRRVVRDYVKTSSYVAESRPGAREEGGEGVTILTLA